MGNIYSGSGFLLVTEKRTWKICNSKSFSSPTEKVLKVILKILNFIHFQKKMEHARTAGARSKMYFRNPNSDSALQLSKKRTQVWERGIENFRSSSRWIPLEVVSVEETNPTTVTTFPGGNKNTKPLMSVLRNVRIFPTVASGSSGVIVFPGVSIQN